MSNDTCRKICCVLLILVCLLLLYEDISTPRCASFKYVGYKDNNLTYPHISNTNIVSGTKQKNGQSNTSNIIGGRSATNGTIGEVSAASKIQVHTYESLTNCTPAGLSNLRKRKLLMCEYMYNNVEWEGFYSIIYYAVLQQITELLYINFTNVYLEGNIGRSVKKPQSMCYYDLARSSGVKTVCEIGFNAGHSTLLWLTANHHIKVYSWDLGEHSYTRPIANLLKSKFPGRLEIFYGNSIKTVPEIIQNVKTGKQRLVCDIISIDGGHTYEVAEADIVNMRALANVDNIVLIDDVNEEVDFTRQVLNAWRGVHQARLVEEQFMCTYKREPRGYLLGTYINL